MKHIYKSECGKIIVHYVESGYYVQKNTTETNKVISKEDFDKLVVSKVKKNNYYRMMNEYFKNIHDEWTYNGHDFVSKDNFKFENGNYSANYTLGKDIPFHNLNKPGEDFYYLKNLIAVYHQGKVYYHTISYNGYDQGQLIDPKTHKFVGWCKLKHCAPIFDKTLKKII